MGQKAVTLTLQPNQPIGSHAPTIKAFLNSTEYINTLKRSLLKKGVIITSHFFKAEAETLNLELELFFRTHKVLRYRKKPRRLFYFNLYLPYTYPTWNVRDYIDKRENTYRKNLKQKQLIIQNKKTKNSKKLSKSTKVTKKINKKINKKKTKLSSKPKLKKIKMQDRYKKWKKNNKNYILSKLNLKEKRVSKLLEKITENLYANKLIVHKFSIINLDVNLPVVWIVHRKLKYFKWTLFSRRFNLYFDFLKMTSLFVAKKINVSTYAEILGTIFKFLLKRSHNKFFAFLKKLFHLLTNSTTIEGLKIGINGKLKGKLRAKPYKMSVGKVSTQSFDAKIGFAKTHIHTLYGCFGLRMWVKYRVSI